MSEDQDKAQSLEHPNKRRSLPERLRAYALSDMLRTSIAGEDKGETENWRPRPVGPLGQVSDTTLVNLPTRSHPSYSLRLLCHGQEFFSASKSLTFEVKSIKI